MEAAGKYRNGSETGRRRERVNWIKNNPVRAAGITLAVLNLIVGLGFLDETQGEVLRTFVESIAVLFGAEAARSEVSKHWQ